MRKIVLILMVFGFVVQGWGQEVGNFKERHRVNLEGFKNSKFKYIQKKDNTIDEESIVNILYNKDGEIISYNKIIEKKIDNSKISILDSAVLQSKNLHCFSSKVNLNLKDNKVYIYPFTYKDNDSVDEFFKTNDVYLELEERHNYSFKYRAWQLGAVTIPVKWYIDSKLGNIETDVNAMISFGHKWGRTHFVKFPHEEEARQYQRTWSFSGLAGISKLAFDENNTIDGSSIKGNVAAISTGVSLGVHYQDFTFLVAGGMDFPTSNHKDWKFNNTPWIGLGFGYNFLKLGGKSN